MKISKGTIIRTIMIIIVAINIVLKCIDKPIISIGEGEIAEFVEALIEIAAIAIGFWKNNSFSQKALIADEYLHELKNEEYGSSTISLEQFENKYKDGKSYDYAGTYKGECVSLVKNYIEQVLGIKPQSIGNAKEYWLKRKIKYISSSFTPVASGQARRGDIFVRTNGTYGHVGIVLSSSKLEYQALEQNAGGSRVVSHMSHIYDKNTHFLRPKNKKNIAFEKKSSECPLIEANATIAISTISYSENTKENYLHSLNKGKRVRCLTNGEKISIIQYAISKTEYASGCVSSSHLVRD